MRKPGRGSKRSTPRKKSGKKPDIDRLFEEGTAIDRAFARAIRAALKMHKRAGNPVPIWREGRVVWIPAHKIPG